MQLHRAFDAPLLPAAEVFRESRGVRVLGTLPVLGLLVASIAYGVQFDPPPSYWLFPATLAVLALAFLRGVAASFRATSWRLRQAPDGLLVQLRPASRSDRPEAEETVLFLPVSEIASAGKLVERTRIRTRRGMETRKRVWLELRLAATDTRRLREALAASPGATPRGVLRLETAPRPVEFTEPDRLRVLWRAQDTWLRPGVERSLALLAERVPVVPERRVRLEEGS